MAMTMRALYKLAAQRLGEHVGELTGKDDRQAADWLNDKVHRGPVPVAEAVALLRTRRKWAAIQAFNDEPGTTARHISARELTGMLNGQSFASIGGDLTRAIFEAALDDAIPVGLLDAGDKTALIALGNNRISRAEQQGIARPGGIGAGTVQQMRLMKQCRDEGLDPEVDEDAFNDRFAALHRAEGRP